MTVPGRITLVGSIECSGSEGVHGRIRLYDIEPKKDLKISMDPILQIDIRRPTMDDFFSALSCEYGEFYKNLIETANSGK